MPLQRFGAGVPDDRPQRDGDDDDVVGVADYRDKIGDEPQRFHQVAMVRAPAPGEIQGGHHGSPHHKQAASEASPNLPPHSRACPFPVSPPNRSVGASPVIPWFRLTLYPLSHGLNVSLVLASE